MSCMNQPVERLRRLMASHRILLFFLTTVVLVSPDARAQINSQPPVDIAATADGYIYVLFDSEVRKYGPAAVPANSTSWGKVKARYR